MSTKEDIATYENIGEPPEMDQRMLVKLANSLCKPGTYAYVKPDNKGDNDGYNSINWRCVDKSQFDWRNGQKLKTFPINDNDDLKVGIPFMDEYCGFTLGYRIDVKRNEKGQVIRSRDDKSTVRRADNFTCGSVTGSEFYFPAYAGLGDNAPVMTYETARSMCQNGDARFGSVVATDSQDSSTGDAFRCSVPDGATFTDSKNWWVTDGDDGPTSRNPVPQKSTKLDGKTLDIGEGNRLFNTKDLSKYGYYKNNDDFIKNADRQQTKEQYRRWYL